MATLTVLTLDLTLTIVSYVSLLLYTLTFLYILVKLKCHLFLGLGSLLFIYEVFFILNAVINTLFYLDDVQNPTDSYQKADIFFEHIFSPFRSMVNRFKWFFLYYLIIQMKIIVIKI